MSRNIITRCLEGLEKRVNDECNRLKKQIDFKIAGSRVGSLDSMVTPLSLKFMPKSLRIRLVSMFPWNLRV